MRLKFIEMRRNKRDGKKRLSFVLKYINGMTDFV